MRGCLWWWRRHASHLNLSKIYWPWSEPTLADKRANDHQIVSHSNNHIRQTFIVQIMKSIQPSENLINNKFSLIFCQKHILLQNIIFLFFGYFVFISLNGVCTIFSVCIITFLVQNFKRLVMPWMLLWRHNKICDLVAHFKMNKRGDFTAFNGIICRLAHFFSRATIFPSWISKASKLF